VGAERQVKLFRNGRNQAVRIPREFELPGTEAIMRREGGRLVIEAAPPSKSLADLLDEWAKEPPLDEEWEEPHDPPPEPIDF
jgi:antitoxin VapB